MQLWEETGEGKFAVGETSINHYHKHFDLTFSNHSLVKKIQFPMLNITISSMNPLLTDILSTHGYVFHDHNKLVDYVWHSVNGISVRTKCVMPVLIFYLEICSSPLGWGFLLLLLFKFEPTRCTWFINFSSCFSMSLLQIYYKDKIFQARNKIPGLISAREVFLFQVSHLLQKYFKEEIFLCAYEIK